MSGSFFSLSPETKLSYGWTTPEANRGYSAPGREKVSVLTDKDEIEKIRQSAPDLKETFEIGREGEPEHPNQWPDESKEAKVEGFKEVMLGFFDKCKALHVEVMRAIAVGMGLDEGFFDGFVDVGDNTLRLLHYPAVEASVFKTDAVRAGAHSDYGSITL
jgi:isopenicillin N synthase-like dioxygenase